MNKIMKTMLLVVLLATPTVGRSINLYDLIAVWLVTKCALYVYCQKHHCCSCTCAKEKKRVTLKELEEMLKKMNEQIAENVEIVVSV